MVNLAKPQQIDLPHLKERIPSLIDSLAKIKTEFSYEQKYLGEAITILRLMQSLLV